MKGHISFLKVEAFLSFLKSRTFSERAVWTQECWKLLPEVWTHPIPLPATGLEEMGAYKNEPPTLCQPQFSPLDANSTGRSSCFSPRTCVMVHSVLVLVEGEQRTMYWWLTTKRNFLHAWIKGKIQLGSVLSLDYHKPCKELNGCLKDSGISLTPALKFTCSSERPVVSTTENRGPRLLQLCPLFIMIFYAF